MKAEVEIYGGIEFVRLSTLTKEDAKSIRESVNRKNIIKILQGKELLSDCLLWSAYLEWYHTSSASVTSVPISEFSDKEIELKLALK